MIKKECDTMIKKIFILSAFVIMCIFPGFMHQSFAAEGIRIEIDGKPLAPGVAPVIENGRTMVPFKAIFEALDLKTDWIAQQRIATAYNGEMNVSIKIDAPYGSIDGELVRLDAPAKIVNGRTLVPLKFISEAFGNEVRWDAGKRLISIKSGFRPYIYTEALPTVDSLEKLKLILEYAGKYSNYIYPYREDFTAAPSVTDGKGAMPSAQPESAPSAGDDHSTTNVQVAGVDEADIVKTDGRTIYQLRSGDIKITDISAASPKNIATINSDDGFAASELYLHDGKLIVIGTRQMFYPMAERIAPDIMPMPPMRPKTRIYFYDVTAPESPKLIRKFEGDGSYMTSRLAEGSLYMVLNKPIATYSMTAESVLPAFTDTLMSSNGNVVSRSGIGFESLRYFPDTVESNLMITLGFDLELMNKAPHKMAYLGSSTNLFADSESMVVALDRYHYDYQNQGGITAASFTNTTELYKFLLRDGTIRFSAKGSVPGRVLNQFSMDAYNGNYRLATTSGETWSDTSQNNIYVLDRSMKLKGKLEGLAPGERIFSARFVGDRAYLVTFRQVDPFYVIDLKNPSVPAVLGYLKIPGFSDYLHPYDSDTLIGFGKDIIETANGPVVGGIKIAMFDVSDVSKPVEKSKILLGSSGSYSEVLYNHRALLFSKDKDLFALPVMLYSGSGTGNRFSFQGAYVYSVNPSTGFVLRGTSTHLTQPEIDDSALKWYDTSKNVSRIIWSSSRLYTISDYGIKSHDLATMAEKGFIKY